MDDNVQETVSLFNNICSQISTVKTQVDSLLNQAKNGDLSTAKGISFLDVKHHLLLSYIMNLGLVMMRKCEGEQISGITAIQRLIEIRTVLEKMRPIDYKLQYQVDKLIKTAITGSVAENDPTRFKPNPNNLVSKLQDEDNSESDDEAGNVKPKKYVPPRVAAMHYVDDESVFERRQRLLEKAKKKALSSSIIQELRDEFNEGPEEIRENVNFHKQKQERAAKERKEYEEEYFKRLPVTKKEKHAQKRLATMSSLDGITSFGDITALSHGVDDTDNFQSKKKKKMPSKLRRILSKKRGKKRKF